MRVGATYPVFVCTLRARDQTAKDGGEQWVARVRTSLVRDLVLKHIIIGQMIAQKRGITHSVQGLWLRSWNQTQCSR